MDSSGATMNHQQEFAGVRATSLLCLSLLLLPALGLATQDAPTLIPPATQPATGPAGAWSGALKTPGQPLAFSIQLNREGEAWKGTLDIPTQGLKSMPLAD